MSIVRILLGVSLVMQVYNNQLFFISLNEDFSRLEKLRYILADPIFNNSKMTIWKIPLNKSESFKKIFNNGSLDIIRYFDCYYLLIPLTKKSVKKLYEEFFDYISHDYENLIDLKRNQENICNLLKIVQKYYNNDTQLVILHYGCGNRKFV